MAGLAETATLRPLQAAEAPASAMPALGRWVKLAIAVALLPVCVGFSQAFHAHFWGAGTKLKVGLFGWPETLQLFGAGAGLFAVLAVLLWRPVVVYVFAHEVVHAIATWMCLGRVTNLRASTQGGSVTTSKSNTFIRLAPYFVPLYTLAAGAVFAGLDHWWKPLSEYRWALSMAMGFTLAFHLGFTLWSLRRDQPDLRPDGWLFSIVLIYLANLLVVAAVLGLVLEGHGNGALEAGVLVLREGLARSAEVFNDILAAVRRALNKG